MKKYRLAFMIVALVMVMALFLTACGDGTTPTSEAPSGDAPTTSTPPAGTSADTPPAQQSDVFTETANAANGYSEDATGLTFKQSPMLDSWTDLPPVAERLPKNPKIANHIPTRFMETKIGNLGGTLNTIRQDPTWDATIWCASAQVMINTPNRLGEEFFPSVLEKYEINDDFTEYTFTLREGMRWSDGTPVTSADAEYSFYYYISDKDMNPNMTSLFCSGGTASGTPAVFTLIDEYSWKYTFDVPYGGFVLRTCFSDWNNYLEPKHYMTQYHNSLGDPDFIQAELKRYGYTSDEWFNMYKFVRPENWHTGRVSQITTPTIVPWLHKTDGEPRVYERNPYYWKVDREGNQLPYFDYVHSTYATDLEAASVKLLAGEIDFGYEWIPLNKISLFKENEEKGGYRILTNTMLHRTDSDLFFNMTNEDDDFRSVVSDVRFRKALSMAIDREDIVDTVYLGFAKVSDINGDAAKYDPDAANALLDEMGMERGSDGFRMTPDGNQLVMDFHYTGTYSQFIPTCTLVYEQWSALDLNFNFRQIENSLYDTMSTANELQISTAFEHGPVQATWNDWGWNRWGRLWRLYWESSGRDGEQPPEWVQEFYDTVDSILTISPTEIPAARQKIRDLVAEHTYMIIPVESVTQCTLINNKLQNYPDAGFMIGHAFACDQWYFGDE